MGDLIIAAGLFTGKPVEEFVVFNQNEVDEGTAEPEGAYFELLPVDGTLDAEYTKRRGQDTHSLRMRPNPDATEGPKVEFEAMEMSISNEREVAAFQWLAEKVVKGWRGIKLDDGTELEYNGKNLKVLSAYPTFIRPVIQKAYELGRLRRNLKEGNSSTS